MKLLAFSREFNLDIESDVFIAPMSAEYLVITSNPSTGYEWKVEPFESSKFDINFVGFEPSEGSEGGAGIQRFAANSTPDASADDTLEVKFIYVRSWENIPAEVKEVTLRIKH